MPVLLLRLAGPMQSWGTRSRFGYRETEREPSKSGVIGLLCAALGVPRKDDETLARLAAMPMGVRVNREGTVASDFQTVGSGKIGGEAYGVARADGGRGAVILSRRDYLAEADFLVGLAHDDEARLHELDAALRAPVWPLCLGRRSYVPGVCPAVGVVGGGLLEALVAAPYPLATAAPDEGLRLIMESPGGDGQPCYDVPVSFSHERRRFRRRDVIISILAAKRVGRGR